VSLYAFEGFDRVIHVYLYQTLMKRYVAIEFLNIVMKINRFVLTIHKTLVTDWLT